MQYKILVKEDKARETEVVVDGLDAAIESFDTIGKLVTGVWNLMTANPLLTLLLGVGLAFVGIGIFKAVKKAVR